MVSSDQVLATGSPRFTTRTRSYYGDVTRNAFARNGAYNHAEGRQVPRPYTASLRILPTKLARPRSP